MQGQQDHRRVVDIGIELVAVLEVPAARLDARPADYQSPGIANLPVEQPARPRRASAGSSSGWPASASAIVAIAVSQTGETQGCSRDPVALLDQQVVELPPGPLHRRGIVLVAQAFERDDRVDHRREDRPQAVGVLEMLEHPAVRRLDPAAAATTDGSQRSTT